MTTYTVTTPSQGEQRIVIKQPPFDKVGLYLSGGLDSALLLELYAREKVNVTPYYIDRKEPLAHLYHESAIKIIDKVNQTHGLNLELVDFEIPMDTDIMGHFIKGREILGDRVECMIVGDNIPPPSDITTGTTIPWRLPVSQQFDYPEWELPFLHVDKSYIIKLMLDLNCEWILDFSRTCAEDEILYNPNLDDQILRCNVCYCCKEREWAFNILGETDTGL